MTHLRYTSAIALLILSSNSSHAQSSSCLMGARAMGMGYASACLKDEWSVFNNVAGLAKVENVTTAFTYHAVPNFPPFNRMAAAAAMPVPIGVAAIGAYRFGDDLYSEQMISGGFANTMGLASLGIRLSYVQYHAEGFGSTRTLSVSAGGIANITPAFSIGAQIININQPRVTRSGGETLPAIMMLGFSAAVSEHLLIAAEVEKDLLYPLTLKTGLEYRAHKKLTIRTGVNLQPNAAFLGFGGKVKRMVLDYSLQWSMHTGINHQAGVSYHFKSKA